MDALTTTLLNTDLSLAGLLFLAPLLPLSALSIRAALSGGRPSWLDTFLLEPGMHRPIKAADFNEGEYPACAALTTGYVFRIENQATVFFLQRVGRTGCLTTLHVSDATDAGSTGTSGMSTLRAGLEIGLFYLPLASTLYPFLSQRLANSATYTSFLAVLSMLYTSRLLGILLVRRRSAPSWHGAPEPGVQGDLLILLSQDRWVRMRGPVDDLKAVTSGAWLREASSLETGLGAVATLLVYLAALLVVNVSPDGRLVLLLLVLVPLPLLCWNNALRFREGLQMHGRVVTILEPPKQYRRRLELAEELIKETGREDWAIKLGMVNRKDSKSGVSGSSDEGVTM